MTDREHSLRVAALEFENARLRAEVEHVEAERDYARSEIRRTIDLAGIEGGRIRNEWQKVITERDALRLDLARVTEHEASLERQLEDTLTWRNAAIDEARAATADLARLTTDAAAEKGRLRAEREAFERQLSSVRFLLSHCTCICQWVHEAKATLAEPEPIIAACAPEVKQS